MTIQSVSTDAHTMMLYEANKKSVGVGYLLWFFLGSLGAHRFYAGRKMTGIAMLLLTIGGALTLFVGVGAFVLLGVGIWVLIDAFLIPGWMRAHNTNLIGRLTGASLTDIVGNA